MAQALSQLTDPPLCTQFGFDTDSRLARLALMNLGVDDQPVLERILDEAILPNSNAIMDGFYAYLLTFPAMRQFLGSAEHISRLKLTQHEYLSRFGCGFESAEYFEYRLRIGVAHERIGMPLSLYLAAYRHMQTLILHALPDSLIQDAALHHRCMDAISKVMMLDMSLAIDTYTTIRIESMSDSISALRQERDVLSNQLMHDTLTGTLSRRFVLESLAKHLSQLARHAEHTIYVALLDLDHFKQVNDAHGHLVGDKVLKAFAQIALNIVRQEDYFGRFGGEEFMLVTVGLSHAQASEVVERIRNAIEQHAFNGDTASIHITVSAGLTMARAGDKLEDLIDRADTALYQAKHAGRNRVVAI